MGTHYQGSEAEQVALDLFIKLMRASNSVSNRTLGPIEKDGLHSTQFGILETLYHLGPLMVSQLADKHLKSRNNFTVVVDSLERQGLVQRARDAEDRRKVIVELTELGRERIQALLPQFVASVLQDVRVLSLDEQRQLAALLKRLGTQR